MVSTQAASPATAWWQRYAEAHRAHAQMIPQLQAHQKVLTEATIALSGRITWEDQVCQAYQHDAFGRLLDYSGSAILALQHELYAGAVPQALLLLEQLIDLRYALFTDLQAAVRVRAKQAHAFAEAEKRALTWRHYAKQEDATERDFAQRRLQFVRSLRVQLSSSHPGKVVWPSLLLRARAVGFEKLYHYLFASPRAAIWSPWSPTAPRCWASATSARWRQAGDGRQGGPVQEIRRHRRVRHRVAADTIDKLVDIIAALEPTFGGINLEDIKAPECFEIEAKLRERMKIPVFHDDQHGTAIIVGAAPSPTRWS
jgi:hypothetical protein